MAILSFSMLPESIGRLYELLVCLSKFGETVSLEARRDKLTVTALNAARTAYAAFALDANAFFSAYDFRVDTTSPGGDRFTCQLLNKALQSVFKGRTNDLRGRESLVERCDVVVQDQPDKTECRIIVKMICKHGMTKTYRLVYESVEIMHALFDKTSASQGWKISSRILREYIEFFGPKTEQLDLLTQDGKAIFTSFTEKVSDGKEVLKQPLETAIAIHTQDFEDFHMQENMHIVISVKDFKAIVTHAQTLRGSISASFSLPSRPLQFSYQNFGVHCEFTLMTTGDLRGASATAAPQFVSNRSSSSRQPSAAPVIMPSARNTTEMPPPARPRTTKPLSSQVDRPSLASQVRSNAAANADQDDNSLFLPTGDDDQQWDSREDEQEEAEDTLGWDPNKDSASASFHPTFRDSTTSGPSTGRRQTFETDSEELEPTQRLSQLHGLFD